MDSVPTKIGDSGGTEDVLVPTYEHAQSTYTACFQTVLASCLSQKCPKKVEALPPK